MRTANYTDLRNNLKGYIDTVIENSDTVVVNRGGGAAVVMISLEEYNALIETAYIASSPTMIQRIEEAEESIAKGKGTKIAAEDLWK